MLNFEKIKKIHKEQEEVLGEEIETKENKQGIDDPRPDLEKDSQLWQLILKIAYTYDEMAHGILHGFRCGGAKLIFNKGIIHGNKLQLKPRIGPDNKFSWQSEQDWERDREKYLLPLAHEIKHIFDVAGDKLGDQNLAAKESNISLIR